MSLFRTHFIIELLLIIILYQFPPRFRRRRPSRHLHDHQHRRNHLDHGHCMQHSRHYWLQHSGKFDYHSSNHRIDRSIPMGATKFQQKKTKKIYICIPRAQHFRINSHKSFSFCYPFREEWGADYAKAVVMFRFVVYYALPLCIIGIFYVLIFHHLMYAANVPGEMQGAMRQVSARGGRARLVLPRGLFGSRGGCWKYIFLWQNSPGVLKTRLYISIGESKCLNMEHIRFFGNIFGAQNDGICRKYQVAEVRPCIVWQSVKCVMAVR